MGVDIGKTICGLLVLLACTGPTRAQSVLVGAVVRIEGWNGAPAGFVKLERGRNTPRNVKVGEPVHAGDRLSVPDGRTTVDVSIGRKDNASFCTLNANPQECTLVVPQPAGVIDRFWHFLSASERYYYHYSDENAVNTVSTRSGTGPPRIGVGERVSVPQAVLSSRRDLWIAWSNGKPPFAVEVRQGGRVLSRIEGVTGQTARPAGLALAPGAAELLVTDANGRAARVKLEAVRALPALGDIPAPADADLAAVYRAVALGGKEDGRFLLEAANALEPLQGRSEPARAILRALQLGQKLH